MKTIISSVDYKATLLVDNLGGRLNLRGENLLERNCKAPYFCHFNILLLLMICNMGTISYIKRRQRYIESFNYPWRNKG